MYEWSSYKAKALSFLRKKKKIMEYASKTSSGPN